LTALASAPLAERDWEAGLTRLRRRLLAAALASPALMAESGPGTLAAFLALQCHLTEYVFAETEEEVDDVRRLVESLEAGDPEAAERDGRLAVVALYRSEIVTRLVRRHPSSSPLLALLIRRLVDEPEREAELARDLSSLAPIEDTVSERVRRQYEESPYPRWVAAQTRWPEADPGQRLHMLVPAFRNRPPEATRVDSILVAGAGTGRQLIEVACLFPRARVVGIDLSRASLAYARRKALELGLDRIEFAQADILGLGDWAERFDLISCAGVLHHMAEPERGLAILCRLLRGPGILNLALYSERARRQLIPVQRYIKVNGIAATPENIRGLRSAIRANVVQDFVEPGEHSDFYTMSECRDLLFHAHEVTFTIPRIERALAANRLAFLGFTFGNDTVPAAYAREFPGDPAMLSLENWRAFEAGHDRAFAEMYQFWAMTA
jgi:SAM-dependent methyltransferase